MSNAKQTIPVQFEKIKEYSVGDLRFTTVKIWLMHLGLNLNNSIFKKESVTKAIPSLANTPIVGYIQENKDGEKDFSDHRMGLEVSNGDIKIKYMCSAYGVIPESNEATFEKKICEDGIEREFLTCKGLLWNKFEDALDIFHRDVTKEESMELAESYTGSFDEEGHFVFEDFYFDGACLLGCDVQPAMTGACVELSFAMSEIQKRLEQFQHFMNHQSSTTMKKEGGQILKTIKNSVDISFSATYRQKRDAISNALVNSVIKDKDGNIISETYYWLNDFDDIYAYIEKSTWTNEDYQCENGRISYTFDEATLTVTMGGEFEKMIVTWVTVEENAKIIADREASAKEIIELRQFKSFTLKEKRDSDVHTLFCRFEEKLSGEKAFATLKEQCANLSLEEIEDKCFALVGTLTTNFSTKPKTNDGVVKLAFEAPTQSEDDGYGGILSSEYNQ